MTETDSPAETATSASGDRLEGQMPARAVPAPAREIGGRESGLDPVRYGDWEKNGRCIDF